MENSPDWRYKLGDTDGFARATRAFESQIAKLKEIVLRHQDKEIELRREYATLRAAAHKIDLAIHWYFRGENEHPEYGGRSQAMLIEQVLQAQHELLVIIGRVQNARRD